MPLLALLLLGTFQIMLEDVPVVFRSDKERALLAYLAVHAERPHRREALTGLFYPEQPQAQAQSNLRKTLFRLRAALGETAAARLLLITPKTVQFNPEGDYTLDVAEFRARYALARQHPHRRAETCETCAINLAAALEIYRGEFLAGFNHSGSHAFEEWAVILRERLHQDAIQALEQLVAFYQARRAWDAVLARAQQLLELEPWRESAHRARMSAFAAQGQRAPALFQYEACQKILTAQFAAAPETATRALYETIRDGTFALPPPPADPFARSGARALTPLIGRTREIETLTARLLDPAQRLHTIVGPGGMGKTRLALATAERVRRDFRDGAVFISLAGISATGGKDASPTNDAIAGAVADALGITFAGSITPARQLQTFLRDKELLVVLDNFEQLTASAAWIVELAASAPQVTVLLTSREPLNVRAETVLRLEGLDLPESDDAAALSRSDSIRLFVERTRRAAGHLDATPENLEQVKRICERVEGMPLAIELAAAWTPLRTLDEIASQLQSNLDFLVTTQRDVPERHASMRAVWNGSWDLLSARERELLMRCSIFRTSIEQEAVKAIITNNPADLDSLVAKSLLRRTADGRYELHELLKQFTSEKLSLSAFKLDLLYRYTAYYLAFAAARGTALEQGDPEMPLQELWRELDEVRAAWQTALDWNQLDLVLTHCRDVAKFYYLTGLFREGLALIESALTHHLPGDTPAQLHILRAEFLERLARYDPAAEVVQALLAQPELDPAIGARAHLRAAWIAYWTGQLEKGRVLAEQTLARAQAIGSPALTAEALYVAGLVEQSRADPARARVFYHRALALYRAGQNRYGECSALVNLADIAVDENALDEALEYGAAALTLATRIGKRFDQAAAHVILGSLANTLDDIERAAVHYAGALRLFREMGNGTGECIALRDLGHAAYLRGDAVQAQAYGMRAVEVAEQVGSPYRQGQAQITLGNAYFLTGNLGDAENAFVQAVAQLTHAGRGQHALDALAGLARIATARGDSPGALARVNEILERLPTQTLYDSDEPSAVYLLCVDILHAQGDPRAAEVLARGKQELAQRAARIRSDALRRQFLEQPPAHRALRAKTLPEKT